jgi:protein SCO1/2
VLGAALAACALLAAGCGSSSAASKDAVQVSGGGSAPGGLRGVAPASPLPKPDLKLTDVRGKPYDLRERTAGKVTLLFFGYTNCPDVCPTTMADIAAALQMAPQVRSRVSVVFVTTDPQRDTGDKLYRWLRGFDPSFVGLRGTLAQVTSAAKVSGVPLEAPERQPNGIWTVAHGTQVNAFTRDNLAHVLYLGGTTVDDYAHDLPILVREDSPS